LADITRMGFYGFYMVRKLKALGLMRWDPVRPHNVSYKMSKPSRPGYAREKNTWLYLALL